MGELKLMTEVMLLLPSPGERGRKASPRVTWGPEMRRRRKKLHLPRLPPNLVVRLNLPRRKALRRAANHQPKLHLLMKLQRKRFGIIKCLIYLILLKFEFCIDCIYKGQ